MQDIGEPIAGGHRWAAGIGAPTIRVHRWAADIGAPTASIHRWARDIEARTATDAALGNDIMTVALQAYGLLKLTGRAEGMETLRRDLSGMFAFGQASQRGGRPASACGGVVWPNPTSK